MLQVNVGAGFIAPLYHNTIDTNSPSAMSSLPYLVLAAVQASGETVGGKNNE